MKRMTDKQLLDMLVGVHKDSESLLVKQVIAHTISRIRVPRFDIVKHDINSAREYAKDTRELLEMIEDHKNRVLSEYKKVLRVLEQEGAVNYSIETPDLPAKK